jgi:LPXTG-motif cell wall-anchored protein
VNVYALAGVLGIGGLMIWRIRRKR